MNGSTENTAHDASERPSRPERFLDLPTAQRMLPLVRQVVAELVGHSRGLHPQETRTKVECERDGQATRLSRQLVQEGTLGHPRQWQTRREAGTQSYGLLTVRGGTV